MQGRFDTSQFTEEEFNSLIDESDGTMREPSLDDPEPEEEESEEPETDEEESTEEPEGEEAEDELDWSTVDERYRQAFATAQSEKDKWFKNHGKLQSQLTKSSQANKEFETTRAKLESRDKQLAQLEEMFSKHPHLVDLLDRELQKATNPLKSQDVPDYLKDDPAFQYMQKAIHPYLEKMNKELESFKEKASVIDRMEAERQQGEHKKALDSQLDAAGKQIKSMLGRDATEEDITEVLQYMVDNKFYGNGKAAALAVFGDQYEKAVVERHQAKMKEKAGKFPSRSKSIPASRVKEDTDMDMDEAIRQSMADARAN